MACQKYPTEGESTHFRSNGTMTLKVGPQAAPFFAVTELTCGRHGAGGRPIGPPCIARTSGDANPPLENASLIIQRFLRPNETEASFLLFFRMLRKCRGSHSSIIDKGGQPLLKTEGGLRQVRPEVGHRFRLYQVRITT